MVFGLASALASARVAHADLDYRAEIVGAEDSSLDDLLDSVSELKTLQDRPPVSAEGLRRRAEGDLGRLTDAAHSLGYWDAQFSYSIDTSLDRAKATVMVVPGLLYHVSAVEVMTPAGRPLLIEPRRGSLLLKPDDIARTAPVVAAEAALLAALGESGHPFARAEGRRVVIDTAERSMAVTYIIEPGAVMRFGPPVIDGLQRLDPAYLEGRVRWRQGEVYDAGKLEETRRALIESGLFSTVRITPRADPADPEYVQMIFDVTERAHRTIGAGIAYNTSEGAAARAFWENRNLFGNAEYLRLAATVGQQIDSFTGNFRRPDFFGVDQDLLAVAQIANETPVAYDSRRALISIGIERRFDRMLSGGIVLQAEKANVTQSANVASVTAEQRTQHYALVGVPAYLKRDTTDDLLNPLRGYRAQLTVTPYQSFSGPNLTFVSSLVSASLYQPVGSEDRAIIAGRMALASIDGTPLAQLPADKRVYAGGGGSIRPYGYELAGPLAPNNNPIGGKSSLVLNLEARVKITENIGVVPFLDAGSYYESPAPQPGRGLFYGVGLGLRYYTPFGPLRLDLATPLRKRSADSPIQVYVSLGQAF